MLQIVNHIQAGYLARILVKNSFVHSKININRDESWNLNTYKIGNFSDLRLGLLKSISKNAENTKINKR
ncbi:MAG: hypothetical protein K0R71_1069 [Bacillales bacterium]|jgi:hypothetical protein|nr:hypothetical protein [Bacillales bacterium]